MKPRNAAVLQPALDPRHRHYAELVLPAIPPSGPFSHLQSGGAFGRHHLATSSVCVPFGWPPCRACPKQLAGARLLPARWSSTAAPGGRRAPACCSPAPCAATACWSTRPRLSTPHPRIRTHDGALPRCLVKCHSSFSGNDLLDQAGLIDRAMASIRCPNGSNGVSALKCNS